MKEEAEKNHAATVLIARWILSSGALAALFTSCGLMYRMGYLQAFGIVPGLLYPDSAMELSYWAFIAALEAWLTSLRLLKGSFAWLVLYIAACLCVGVLLGLIFTKAKAWAENTRVQAVINNRWTNLSVVVARGIIFFSAVPWVVLSMAAVLLFLPLQAHELGGKAAVRGMQAHQVHQPKSCVRLMRMEYDSAQCVLIVAQNKDWTAYWTEEDMYVVRTAELNTTWPKNAGPPLSP
ncbi:hypothetical protein [Ramlibacter tataouinensis]|uniref:hypothetical protein n=1 Tax=Ramlibacter tataouinensis TaxID=94132 RepID=UPI00117FE68B|nr:hypothetical protein [Ramlibacter tataouinensis]